VGEIIDKTFCLKCGVAGSSDARFCANCGALHEESSESDAEVDYSHRKENLYRVVAARSDMGTAYRAAAILANEPEDLDSNYHAALHTAMIVSYARPFTHNEPVGQLGKKWRTFAHPNGAGIHEELMRLRHKMVAHSDVTLRRVFIIPKGTDRGPAGIADALGTSLRGEVLSEERLRQAEGHCYALGSRINDYVEDELAALYGDLNLPPEKLELEFGPTLLPPG
jgi:hypothetical protein